MFVLVTERVVKVNTGAGQRDKFAPRTANQTRLTVSGPFESLKTAQRAALTALGVHTCLSAQVYSEAQVRELHARGYSRNGNELHEAVRAGLRLIEAATEPATA
jgi:hypothetical protein